VNLKIKKFKTRIPILIIGSLLSSPLYAGHPQVNQMDDVNRLAHEMHMKSEHVHKVAERYVHHGDSYEAQAITLLHNLHKAAEHFHNTVEEFIVEPRHTEKDYLKLMRAFLVAQRKRVFLHGKLHVQKDFNKMENTMQTLMAYYNASNPQWARKSSMLAHKIADKAGWVHYDIEDPYRLGSFLQRQVFSSIHNLAEKAEHLHVEIEEFFQSPKHTLKDLKALNVAFKRVKSAVAHSNLGSQNKYRLGEVQQLLRQLNSIYGIANDNPHDPKPDPHDPPPPRRKMNRCVARGLRHQRDNFVGQLSSSLSVAKSSALRVCKRKRRFCVIKRCSIVGSPRRGGNGGRNGGSPGGHGRGRGSSIRASLIR